MSFSRMDMTSRGQSPLSLQVRAGWNPRRLLFSVRVSPKSFPRSRGRSMKDVSSLVALRRKRFAHSLLCLESILCSSLLSSGASPHAVRQQFMLIVTSGKILWVRGKGKHKCWKSSTQSFSGENQNPYLSWKVVFLEYIFILFTRMKRSSTMRFERSIIRFLFFSLMTRIAWGNWNEMGLECLFKKERKENHRSILFHTYHPMPPWLFSLTSLRVTSSAPPLGLLYGDRRKECLCIRKATVLRGPAAVTASRFFCSSPLVFRLRLF